MYYVFVSWHNLKVELRGAVKKNKDSEQIPENPFFTAFLV